MRCLIAFLAAVALLANPVAATAAQFACDRSDTVMAGVDQPMVAPCPDRQMAGVTPAPCCDHAGGQKTDRKSCAQACSAACAAPVARPEDPAGRALAWSRAPAPVVTAVWPHGHDPSGLERPPKPIA